MTRLAVRCWRTGAALLGVSIALNAASLTVVLRPQLLEPEHRYWREFLDVLLEGNLPTWWSSALLVTAALAHAMVGAAGRVARAPGAAYWFVSAVVLAGLSLDDHTQLHERTERIGRQLVTFERFPFHWLVPGLVAGVAVAAALTLLVVRVHGATRWLLVAGMTLLLGCALGLETVQGVVMSDGVEGTEFALVYHVEELGENVATLLLLAAAARAVSMTRIHGALDLAYRAAG